ncbi:MAG: hypothetical protein ACK4KT_00585 [Thermaurantimonas sp.]
MKYKLSSEPTFLKVSVLSVDNPQDLYSGLDTLMTAHLDRHFIVNVSGLNLKESYAKEIQRLLDKFKTGKRSIIFITSVEDLSFFDERSPVVPTFVEAVDFLEMEEIERKLTGEGEEE